MRSYKAFSLILAAVFATVGLIFIFFPASPLIFFNSMSVLFGLPQSPVTNYSFYLILAAAYMYAVTLLAYMMYRHPKQSIYPLLLANFKLASSIISLCLFTVHQPYLIYLVNFIIDGSIGIAAIYMIKILKTEV